MIPGGFAYTWLGYAGSEAAGGSEHTMQYIVIGIALFAIVIYIPHIIKKFKRASNERTSV